MLSSNCFVCALGVSVLVTGCGPSDESGGGSTASGGAATGGATTGSGGFASGGSPSGGSVGTGGTTSGDGPKSGTIGFFRFAGSQIMTANFRDTASTATCVTNTVGVCSSSICGEVTPNTAPRPDAGTVTFTSPDIAGSAVATPDAAGVYSSTVDFQGVFFGGEEHGVFSASGGEVPAFEVEAQMPLALLLGQPVITAGIPQKVSRSSDLSLEWSRGAAGVMFFIQAFGDRPDGQPGSSSFNCEFPSEAGSGVIPSSILQAVRPGATVNVLTVRRIQKRVGEFDVYVWIGLDVFNETKDASFLPEFE